MLTPLSIVLSTKFTIYMDTNQAFSSLQDVMSLDPMNFDRFLRHLSQNIDNFYYNYQLGGMGIQFENIFVNHIIECSYKNCFCSKLISIEKDLSERKEFVKQEERKKFLLNQGDQVISQYFKQKMFTLKRNPMIRLAYSHICFIFEIMGIETKAHFTHQFFKNYIKEKKGGRLHIYYLEILERRIRQSFIEAKEGSENAKINVLKIIDFDDNVTSCKQLLFDQMIKVGNYYEYLCNHFIALKDLFFKSIKLVESNQNLIQAFQLLFSINPLNMELQFLAAIYSSTLDFEDKRFSQISLKQNQQATKSQLQLKQYFQTDSCVVYSSFMEKIITIQKVSRYFENIFRFNNKYIISKPLNTIIPKYFQADHEEILDNFRNKGQMSIINSGQRLIFAQNGAGFITPLMISLKIESGINDFGVSALFKMVDNTKDYIFLSEENQILDMTENILNIVFSHTNLQISDLRRIFMLQLIPLLWITEEAKEYSVEYNTIFVINKEFLKEMSGSAYQSLNKRKQVKEMLYIILEQTDNTFYYNITFKHCLYRLASINKVFKYIEISYIQQEKKQQTLEISLHYLTKSLNDLVAKKIIQSKESTQLRLFKRRQETGQSNINNNIQNDIQENKNDWDFLDHRKSLATPSNLQNKIQRKSFLATFAQNNNLVSLSGQQTSREETNEKVNIEILTKKDDLNNTNFEGQEIDQNQGLITQEQFIDNTKLNQNDQSINLNKFNENLNYSQRNLMTSQQESFCLSPLGEQQISFLSPKVTQVNPNNSFASSQLQQIISKSNQNLEKQVRKRVSQMFSSSDLIKIEEEYIQRNFNQQNNRDLQKNTLDIIDIEAKLDKNGKKAKNNIVNESQSGDESSSDEDTTSIKSEQEEKDLFEKEQIRQDDQKQKDVQMQHKMNLRRYSIGMQINLTNNLNKVDKEQFSPTILQGDNNNSELNKNNDNTKANLISLRLINLNLNQNQQDLQLPYQDLAKDDIYNQNEELDNLEESNNERIENELRRSLSQSSKISSNYSQKKTIIQKIKSQRLAGVLLFMIFLCLISFTLFLAITVLMYFNSNDSLLEFQNALEFIDKPVFVFVDTLKIVKSTTYYYLALLAYGDVFDTDVETQRLQQAKDSRQDASDTLENYTKIYQQLHQNFDYNNKVIGFLSSNYLEIDFFTFGVISQEDQEKDLVYYQQTKKTVNQFAAISIYYSNMYRYIISYDKYIQDTMEGVSNIYSNEMNAHFIWENLLKFNDEMYKFSTSVSQDTLQSFEVLENFQLYLVLIILGVCCISILSAMPLYSSKEISREKILMLFGSFPPEVLNEQIERIEHALAIIEQKYSSSATITSVKNINQQQNILKKEIHTYQNLQNQSSKDENHHQNSDQKDQQAIQMISNSSRKIKQPLSSTQFPISSAVLRSDQQLDPQLNLIQRNLNKRNRSIASFKLLPKFNICLLLISLFSIGILMIQPIVTLSLTKQFIDEQKTQINEKSIILTTLRQILQNQAPHYAVFDFLQRGYIAKNTMYFKYLKQVNQYNNQILKDLSSLVDFFSQNRRNENNFKKFYEQILNGNICEIKDKFKQYFQSNFTMEECENLSNGILKRGLILSTKQAFDIWEDFFSIYELYSSEDDNDTYYWPQGYYKVLEIITQDGNMLFNINNLNNIIIQSLEAIISYQNEAQNQYGNYIQVSYNYLFLAQILIIIFIFLICWVALFKIFKNQLIQTKSIFTLFHISLLTENPIIVKYFKENSFGIK